MLYDGGGLESRAALDGQALSTSAYRPRPLGPSHREKPLIQALPPYFAL
jgi:hypothetical protein